MLKILPNLTAHNTNAQTYRLPNLPQRFERTFFGPEIGSLWATYPNRLKAFLNFLGVLEIGHGCRTGGLSM